MLYVGAITGSGDVEFASSYASDGDGVVVLTKPCSYSGDTFLAQGSARTASATQAMPMVRLGGQQCPADPDQPDLRRSIGLHHGL